MKKIGFILLVLILAMSLMTGCGGTSDTSDSDQAESAQNQTEEKTEAADGTEEMGDLLSSAYVDMMKDDEYLMSYKAVMDFEGQQMEMEATIAVSGDDSAMISKGNGFESTVITKVDKVYMIDHASKTVTSWDQTQDFEMGDMDTNSIDTEGMTYLGNGKEGGLVYEEYSTVDGSVKYYFDGKDLVKIATTVEGQTVVMDIIEMSNDVPASMFEIPAGYQKIEM